jgi:F-type H+-transporting ATPase subunit gamma
MKMVAAAKLRRAQEAAEAARPYASRMDHLLDSLVGSFKDSEGAPPLLVGTGAEQNHLIIACTADRGLCGGFNGSIIREVRKMAKELSEEEKSVTILCIGRKGRDALKREFSGAIAGEILGLGHRGLSYSDVVEVSDKIIGMFEAGDFDVCTMVFNRFKSAMTQIVTRRQLIPFAMLESEDETDEKATQTAQTSATFIFEPEEGEMLEQLLPRNIETQVFQALIENNASEQGARMTAMDSATRNADDMIDDLTLTYNRTRQATITKELIEIISGAEAL